MVLIRGPKSDTVHKKSHFTCTLYISTVFSKPHYFIILGQDIFSSAYDHNRRFVGPGIFSAGSVIISPLTCRAGDICYLKDDDSAAVCTKV